METAWFVLITLMIAGYAVTDGYDLGVGIVAPLVARNNDERIALRAAIISVWGANEVWLIAMGGLLFMAFPRAYAVGFSGFYLAFLILVWCLIGRGLALEMRSHLRDTIWQAACDILLPISSLLVALSLGVAVGNVLRGVPLDAQGRLFLPLWTDLSLRGGPAIFDWYTLLVGLLAVAVWSWHGTNYLICKTESDLHRRARQLAKGAAAPVAGLALAVAILSPIINPGLAVNYVAYPAAYLVIAGVVIAFMATFLLGLSGHDSAAFAASGLLIVGFVAAVAIALYPNLLPAGGNAQYSLTIHNASARPHGLMVALIWFGVGLCLVGGYTIFTVRLFAGRVGPKTL